MPVLSHISASQFKTHDLCPRKHWLEKFSDLPKPPPSPSIILGSATHKALEDWLEDGTHPDTRKHAGRLANNARQEFPPPKTPGCFVEGRIELLDCDPKLIGFIDYLDLRDPSLPVVLDLKTTKDWKWAKTSEQLARDLQMIPYAVHALRKSQAARVEFCHVAVITQGLPETRKTSVILTADDVGARWDAMKKKALLMKEHAAIEDPADVPCDRNGCGAFGGCYAIEFCNALGRPGIFSTINRSKKMGLSVTELLERKRRERAVKTAGASGINPPKAEEVEAPAPEVEVEEVEAPAPAPEVEEVEEVEEPAPKATKKTGFDGDDYTELAKHITRTMRAGGHKSLSPEQVKGLVREVLGLKRVTQKYAELACEHSEGVLEPVPGGGIIRSQFMTSPKGETNETSKVVEEPEDETPKADEPAPEAPEVTKAEEVPTPEAEPENKDKEATPTGFALLIDCAVVKSVTPGVTLEDLIAPAIERVCAGNNVSDPLLMDYGKGKDLVGALVAATKIEDGIKILVNSRSPYWPACSAALIRRAAVVIRGVS